AQVPFFRNPAELTAFGFATKNLVRDMAAAKIPLDKPEAGAKALLKYVPDLAKDLMRLEKDVYQGPAGKLKAEKRALQMLTDAGPATFPRASLAGTTFWSGAPI